MKTHLNELSPVKNTELNHRIFYIRPIFGNLRYHKLSLFRQFNDIYSPSEIASTGHTSAQAPQSIQVSGSIT